MPQPGVFPHSSARPTRSYAEIEIYDALVSQLPKGWYAWHSLRVRSEGGSDGEGDFVIADPEKGILILEVKGGQILLQDGHWFQNAERMKEAPRNQGNRFGRKLVDRLKAMDCIPPAWGVATCFPDTAFDRQPTNDDVAGLVLGKQDIPWMREALKEIMKIALAHHEISKGPWIDRLHQFWGETWTPHLRLGQRAQLEGEERLKLDDEQLAVLDALADNESILIEGGAGTGKTLLAREIALRLANNGKRALLLCFTDPLAKWLAQKTIHEHLKVSAIRRLAAEVLGDAGIEIGERSSPEFWKDISWRAAAEALPNVEKRWDVVIVDEGQDFAPEDWLLVEELSRGKQAWAFWDPTQAFWADRHIRDDLFRARYRLKKSYRCPDAVRVLAETYIGKAPDESALAEGVNSGIIGVISCPNPGSVHKKVALEVDKLRSEGLAPSDIAILSLRGNAPEESVVHLEKMGAHSLVRADAASIESNVVVETFLRFKGLERPAIIVTDLRLARERSDYGKRMYIALTRATTAVRIVDDKDTIAADPILARLMQK